MAIALSGVTPRTLPFRFDALNHEYLSVDTGEVFPHITGMLEQTGWIDDRWYTEESSDRGTAVHKLTADYDLGALHVESCQSKHRGYLLAHVKAVSIAKPKMLAVEEPLVHPVFRFGGRPDRDCIAYALRSTWEIKSGAPERAHQVQTALQAILIGHVANLPPESIGRFCEYVGDKGKFKVERFVDRRDFDEARRVIRTCCGR
jgi:hypothetical protein